MRSYTRAYLAEEFHLAANDHHVLRPYLPSQQPTHAARRSCSRTGLRGGGGGGGSGGGGGGGGGSCGGGGGGGARSVWRRCWWLSKGTELVVRAQDEPIGGGRRRGGGGGAAPHVLPLHHVHHREDLIAGEAAHTTACRAATRRARRARRARRTRRTASCRRRRRRHRLGRICHGGSRATGIGQQLLPCAHVQLEAEDGEVLARMMRHHPLDRRVGRRARRAHLLGSRMQDSGCRIQEPAYPGTCVHVPCPCACEVASVVVTGLQGGMARRAMARDVHGLGAPRSVS